MAYLALTKVLPNETLACRKARVRLVCVRKWRLDPDFAAVEADLAKTAVDGLVASAWQYATEGRVVPVFNLGVKVGERREYSEKLLVELLKGFRPEVFDRRALKPDTVNNTILMASPEQIRDVVRRLSPTVAEIVDVTPLPSLPDIEQKS